MEQTGVRSVQLPGPMARTFFGRFGLFVPGSLAAGLLVIGLLAGTRR
jgi:hypothetical protein